MAKLKHIAYNCLSREVYEPILKELEEYGVIFKETQMPYIGYNPDKLIVS